MSGLKQLGLPIMAAGLKEGDEVLQDKRNGVLCTIYLQDNRVVDFQLVPNFEQGMVISQAMAMMT